MSPETSEPERPADGGVAGTGPTAPSPASAPALPPVTAAGPAESAASAEPPRPLRSAVLSALAGVLLLSSLGVPFGLLWRALAPSVPVVKTEEGAVSAQSQPEEFIAADGWFSLIGLGLGVLAAIAVWLLLRRWRGPLGLIVVVVGCVGAALVAWRFGRLIGLSDYQRMLESAAPGDEFGKPADLRAGGVARLFGVLPVLRGDVLLPAFGAAVAYTLLAGWSRWPSLRPEPEPAAGPVLAPDRQLASPPEQQSEGPGAPSAAHDRESEKD